jgi:DNA-binding Lrp family transcriptional regulator
MSVGLSLNDTRAYVLIDSEPEMTDRVVQSLRGRGDVRMADAINGPHDVIAVIEGSNASAVATAILMSIRKLHGVKDITVYLATPQREESASPELRNIRLTEKPDVLKQVSRTERRV